MIASTATPAHDTAHGSHSQRDSAHSARAAAPPTAPDATAAAAAAAVLPEAPPDPRRAAASARALWHSAAARGAAQTAAGCARSTQSSHAQSFALLPHA